MKMNSNEIKDFALAAIFPYWLWSKKRLETGRVRICIYIMRTYTYMYNLYVMQENNEKKLDIKKT